MQRLLYRLLQGNAAIGCLGQIARSQPMSRECLGIEPRLATTRFEDQIDRLRRQRSPVDVAPLVDTTKNWPSLDPGRLDPSLQCFDRPADQNVSGQPMASGLKFQGMRASISDAGQPLAMRLRV